MTRPGVWFMSHLAPTCCATQVSSTNPNVRPHTAVVVGGQARGHEALRAQYKPSGGTRNRKKGGYSPGGGGTGANKQARPVFPACWGKTSLPRLCEEQRASRTCSTYTVLAVFIFVLIERPSRNPAGPRR